MLTVSPSCSQRVGTKGGMGKAEHGALLGQAVDPELVALMRADDGQLVLAASSLVPPAWSIWAWVIQMALRFRPRRSTSHSICSISPPGSMTAASMVWSHQTREQFC
jgi:hypothetical protein